MSGALVAEGGVVSWTGKDQVAACATWRGAPEVMEDCIVDCIVACFPSSALQQRVKEYLSTKEPVEVVHDISDRGFIHSKTRGGAARQQS